MIIKMKAQELRQLFFSFFRSKGHSIVPSAPMIIKNDPTLMFTNAGMNQFKDIFLGNEQPINSRVANSQKCLRVSGKHNDLEEVGHDTYHHTMFEMLGNWSFGDYFKKEAIEWGWELLVKNLEIPEDRLYATVFKGDEEDNLPGDNEAFGYWEKCFSNPEGRILEGSKKDNFWEMGETGPCGPCSEIHIDIRDDDERKKIPGKDLVNKGHPHVIEIWNLVFIQYNRRSDGVLEQLPAKHVDTGMGFERLCMVVQGKKSNYETDIFQSLIKEISTITGRAYGVNGKWDIALRVVADHLRAVSFSIADGQLPSNNKAGYVIRRILRRAVRYGYNNLGIEEPFIYKLVPVLYVSALKYVFFHINLLLLSKKLYVRFLDGWSFASNLSESGLHFLQELIVEYSVSGGQSYHHSLSNTSPQLIQETNVDFANKSVIFFKKNYKKLYFCVIACVRSIVTRTGGTSTFNWSHDVHPPLFLCRNQHILYTSLLVCILAHPRLPCVPCVPLCHACNVV